IVKDDAVEPVAEIAEDLPDEVGCLEAVGLAVLRHEVAHVDPVCLGAADGGRDTSYEEVREDARVEISGPDHDDVRSADGSHGVDAGVWVLLEEDSRYRQQGPGVPLAAGIDVGHATAHVPARHLGTKRAAGTLARAH